ncbi:hemerythrin domain-containing protein [Pyxidicoccus sp. 3LFB2]
MDALTLLKTDHREVEALFKKFEASTSRALKARRKLVDQMIAALSRHAAIEEQLLYPAMRQRMEAQEEGVLQALEEHHVVKWVLNELVDLPAEHERFSAKVHVLMENVREHVREEERVLFVQMKKTFEPSELKDLGAALETAKKAAPTRPHPRMPDTPPGNMVVGAVAAMTDMGRDIVRGARKRAGLAKG